MEIQITLAGANFRPTEAKDYIKNELKVGDRCNLVRDSTNQYDERAVQIHGVTDDDTIFIGFVPKSDNVLLSQAMDTARFADEEFEYTCECTGFIGTLQPTFIITFQASALDGVTDVDDENFGD